MLCSHYESPHDHIVFSKNLLQLAIVTIVLMCDVISSATVNFLMQAWRKLNEHG